eukprot:COSAG02_NODE_877_length_16272_cov_8.002288_5_plen_31_part_00
MLGAITLIEASVKALASGIGQLQAAQSEMR